MEGVDLPIARLTLHPALLMIAVLPWNPGDVAGTLSAGKLVVPGDED
jgi:hypothetical protein